VSETVPLAGDWRLWRDFAVRSAGFPVSGLDAFGPGDESGRLADVANDARFQEAVTWQNPAALANAVLKVASRAPTKPPSRARGREEIVASYWQRYCGKNDTIGFFGPLAWGHIADEGPPLHATPGGVERTRAVHFESWPVQALADTIDPNLVLPAGPHAERDLRAALDAHPDADARVRGLAALDRLEAGRDAIAAAAPADLRAALAALDETFVELTGQDATRNPGMAYGARTLCYLDCMRDVDVTMSAAFVQEMAPALQALFEACRWYAGRAHSIGKRIIDDALPAGGRTPFMPVMMQIMPRLMQIPPELDDLVEELHRRLETLLADPARETLGARADAAFADREPPWRLGQFQSADVQVAARGPEALADGDFLGVVGDVHVGNNPLIQGVFANRHPDQASLMRRLVEVGGVGMPLLLPPWAPGRFVESRGLPVTPDEFVHIAVMPTTRAQGGRRTWLPDELYVEGREVVDATGALRMPIEAVFGMPIFVTAVRTFTLLPQREHAPRVTIGRMVLRREGWSIPATEIPERADDVGAFARDRGMPRRLFMKSPLERKPMYLDTESATLSRILCRQARHAREQPGARMEFTEMLPGPDECWLTDAEGNHYVSELRIAAVDAASATT
jgi:Lantibiotic dehydratase, N terminus